MTTDGALFVGRESELEKLRARLVLASAGSGSVIALVGEAGIGKTRAARAFAAYARGEGARVAFGGCAEGEWPSPLLPWSGALGDVVAELGARKAQRAVGAARAALAHVVPGLGAPAHAEPLGAREERMRLHHAVTQLLARASSDAPLVVVLDDLHWADSDSLRVLHHVAREASRSRWLFVITYREENEPSARTPLGELIAGLRRDGIFERVPLRGFAPAEVGEYLARRAGEPLTEAAVRFIFEETVGNPLYVREVFDHMEEEGALARAGVLDEASMRAVGVPRGVREVVGRRLGRLREATANLMRAASVVGEPVDGELLAAVCALSEPALLDCLDEAIASGLLRTTPSGAYEPSHAIVRRAIHDGLNPDRRARLHRKIAESLESFTERPGRAAMIAAHYRSSVALGGAELGASFAIEAAREALAACAHDGAVGFLRLARELARGAPSHIRAEALCELVLAEARALHVDESLAALEEALAELEIVDTPSDAVAAYVAEVARELKSSGAPQASWEPLVERGLAMVGTSRDLTWARLALLVDRVETLASGAVHVVRTLPRGVEAVRIARDEGDEDDHASTLEYEYRTRAETDEVIACARQWSRPTAVLRAFDVAIGDLLYRHVAVAEARALSEEMLAVAVRCGAIPAQAEALVQLAHCEAMLGEIERAKDTSARAHALVARLGPAHRLHAIASVAVASTIGYLAGCDWRVIAEAAARFSADPASRRSPIGHIAAGIAAIGYAFAGYAREARSLLLHLAPVFERCDVLVYHYGVALDLAATAVWHLGARDLAERYRALERAAPRDAGAAPYANRDLVLSRLGVLVEDWDAALDHIAHAERSLAGAGLRPLHAIALHDEASALLRAGNPVDRIRARERLGEALATFRALGMDPWIAHAHQLLGLERPTYPDGLTSREVEILRLVASGRSNREIAASLALPAVAVQKYVAGVYAKIGANGRAAATAYAIKHRLSDSSA